MLYDDGKISPLDWQIYQQYIQTFTDQSKVDALVYVRTSPETCQERIQVRDRDGGIKYLSGISPVVSHLP